MTTETIEGLYIHIPFCLKKCHYCDFFSVAEPGRMADYIECLKKEMYTKAATYHIRPKTIFIGGGTPTALSGELLEDLLATVKKLFITDELVEYTMEANPGTVDDKKLRMMYRYGVNRISFGVQSDEEEFLTFLGRIHSFEQAKEAVQMARMAGFQNINLDFIYGIPGQTTAQWEKTLEHALELKPEHLSLYQLKIEEGTILYDKLENGEIGEFDDETALEMYRTNQNFLGKNGYQQYEISNYSKPGKESLHNQTYWETENYLGFGMAGCSWVRPKRVTNTTLFQEYCEDVESTEYAHAEVEILNLKEQMEETVFMALRMNKGLSRKSFFNRFQKTPEDVFPEALEKCLREGWIILQEEYYRLTEEGRVIGNLVFMEFLD